MLILALAVSFTHGVASGDVTPTSAVLWTRVDREASLQVEVSPDPNFPGKTLTRTATAIAATDFTVKVIAEPLDPARPYYYRFTDGETTSDTGSFRTAPPRDISAPVRFVFTGDSDGTRINGQPAYNQFEVLDAARRENPDFFVYLGDTIYADSDRRPAPARTLDEYRALYKENREYSALRGLMQAVSTYAIWDDHEVHNDFAGQTVDRALFAAGRRAFLEYMPLLNLPFPDRASCAADPMFRLFRWGSDIDLIILDERSCRSADAEHACSSDPAPALSSLLRLLVNVPPSPPPGCLDALRDSSRTLLGGFQKLVFKSALLYSKAKFKFVINEVPIQQIYGFPYDRWEGYASERDEILRFIRDHNIANVIFLTTDLHANFLGKVVLDRLANPVPVADEFVAGPIATHTFEKEIQGIFPLSPDDYRRIFEVVGVECAEADTYGYGLVEVQGGAATISLKNDRGEVLCRKTIGP
jgi:alkaline phosphatase D